ncbi:MAG: hypothetical protein ACLFU4_08230 [Opitutales bacterium]
MADDVDRLQAGDVGVIPRLVEVKDEAIRELLDRFERDQAQIPRLLKQLGAETYKQRIEAVRELTLMGRKVRDAVTLYREANRQDPEIVYRANQVLESTSREEQIENQTAIVRFFAACGDLPAEVLLPFSADFRAVLEDADNELTTSGSIPPEIYRQLIQHLTLLPDLQDPMIDALLRSPNRKATMSIFRKLLQQDFKKYFPMIIGENRYLTAIERLVDRYFQDQLGDRELHLLLVQTMRRSKYKLDFEFNADTEITPERAFAILNKRGYQNLGAKTDDLLFKKLALMPNEKLLKRLRAEPVSRYLITRISERRKDLRDELTEIIRHQSSKTITRWWLWKGYMNSLKGPLKYEMQPGEFDKSWCRMILLNPTKYRAVESAIDFNISPIRITEMLTHPELALEPKFHLLTDLFNYVLKSGDSVARERLVTLLLPDAPWQKKNDFSDVKKMWEALITHADSGFLKKKLELAEKLDTPSHVSPFKYASDLAPLALEFYRANREEIDLLSEDQRASQAVFFLAGLISFSLESITPEELIQLRNIFDVGLNSVSKLDRDAHLITLGGMYLGSNSELWKQVAFRHMADPDIYADVPFWLLNEKHADQIALIESKLNNEETRHIAYLRAGLMIRPRHPAWAEQIDGWLHKYGQTETIADLFATMNVIGTTPSLSELSSSRLKELFLVNSKDDLLAIDALVKELNRSENKNVVLKELVPQLKQVFEINWCSSRWNLPKLVGENPAAWPLAGGPLLRMLESADQEIQRRAKSFLVSFEPGSPDGLKEIAKYLEEGDLDSWIQNSLIWLVAKHGQQASWMIDVVRKYPADKNFSKRMKALAEAAITPDPEERRNRLSSLLDSQRKNPDWVNLYQISRIRGFDEMTRPFLREAVEKKFWATHKKDYPYVRRMILNEMSNFPEPELARILYRDVLKEMATPGPKKKRMKFMVDLACLRLSHQLVDDLPEFRELLHDLPPSVKALRHYRMVMERMPETDG